MSKDEIVVGTRGSTLALKQTSIVTDLLQQKNIKYRIKIIKTTGDRIKERFSEIGARGVFTKELEEALLNRTIDMAIHSLKDLETTIADGTEIVGVIPSGPQYDVFIVKKDKYSPHFLLPVIKNGKIGTSSIRREALINFYRKDLKVLPLRGNIMTRINKLMKSDEYDAIILSASALSLLDINRIDGANIFNLQPEYFVPQVGQSHIAIQVRKEDYAFFKEILDIDMPEYIALERKMLKLWGGGCSTPATFKLKITPESIELFFMVKQDILMIKGNTTLEGRSDFSILPSFVVNRLRISFPLPFSVFITDDEPLRYDFFDKFKALFKCVECFPIIKHVAVAHSLNPRILRNEFVLITSKTTLNHVSQDILRSCKIVTTSRTVCLKLEEKGIVPVWFPSKDMPVKVLWLKLLEFLRENDCKRIYHIGARETTPNLNIISNHCEVIKIPVYETVACIPQHLQRKLSGFDIVGFTSPSSVRAFIENGGDISKVHSVAIGETTLTALNKEDGCFSPLPSIPALMEKIVGCAIFHVNP